jgi:glycosyltransferase involved in cell wall biosynthesis
MKILHVVNVSFVLPYYLGEQITYFKNKNYIIHISCTESNELFDFCDIYNINCFPIRITRKFDILSDIASVYRLYKIIKSEHYDAVIGHTPKGGLISMLSSFLCGTKKRIYFRHGLMYETSNGFKRSLLINIEKLSSFLATNVICVSQSVLNKSIKNKLSDPSKCIILNNGTCNGIDSINQFNPDLINYTKVIDIKKNLSLKDNDIIVGFIGRIVKDKGINELVGAWQLLLNKHSNIKLVIIGPIEIRDPIRNDVLEYINTEKSIRYLGEVHNPLIYYSIFDIFVLPSYREGFPTVVLEASSMNLPIITTRSTGCIDSIIENKTGIYCEITSESISNSIDFYINNPLLRKLHGINGRNFVINDFNQKIIWEQLGSLYTNQI